MRGLVWALLVGAILSGGAARAHPAVNLHATHRHRPAKAGKRRHRVAIAAPVVPAARPYAPALSARSDEPMPTALRYRFGHGRVIGAVGYNRVTGGAEIDTHEVNSAAGTQFGHPDATVGARVRIPF